MVQLVNAAEVCVVVDYGDEGKKPDGDCIDIDQGKNGYELLNQMKWDIEWKAFGFNAFAGIDLGHGLCRLEGVGNDVDVCWGTSTWNLNLARDGDWLHMPVAFDAEGGCWNGDKDSTIGHYCTNEGDVLGLAFGEWGVSLDMFKVNVSKIYVDGDKQKESKTRGGKIVDVFPESTVELKIEVENLYDSDTKIEITDIAIEGTIEEIDDGDDIIAEVREFDLAADREVTKELKFTIPLEVKAKDRLLKIEIDAEDDAGIKYSKEITFDMEVEKESHDLRIMDAKLSKESYSCGENALLSLSALNVGDKDEDVRLRIVNYDLGIDITKSFEVSNDVYDRSSRFEDRFSLDIPEGVDKKTYPISVALEYGSEKEESIVDLVVKDCETLAKVEEEVTVVKSEVISNVSQTEAEKDIVEGETITAVERIDSNIGIILGLVLGILVIVIVGLGVMFLVLRK